LTLWQAVLSFVENEPGCDRERVLRRFEKDGEINVIAVLNDLVGSGLLFSSGRGITSMYRPASEADRDALASREAGVCGARAADLPVGVVAPAREAAVCVHAAGVSSARRGLHEVARDVGVRSVHCRVGLTAAVAPTADAAARAPSGLSRQHGGHRPLTVKGMVECVDDPLLYSDEELIDGLSRVFEAAASRE
jgi:hypothetical protein